MSSTLIERPAPPSTPRRAAAPRRRTRLFALPEARWAAAALLLFALALPLQLTGAPAWLWGPLYAGTYAAGGWEPGWAGLRALCEKTLDVDLLMVVAALGAAVVGQATDGALLIVIFAVSGALEALATARTADSVRGLLDLAPATATRLLPDGVERTVPVEELTVGDTVLVRPGERIGADGRVLDGASEVDQASITGEPLPAAKNPGDEVFAGTLNGTGALRVRVERDAAGSVIARIVAMVEEASGTKAPTQLFIEKVEQRYSLAMVAATLAVFAVPLAFGSAVTDALLRAMTFMIVASPCAVVLATMPPLLSAIANAGRHGVLVKSAAALERLGRTAAVALDKTGTLTEGTPRLTAVRPLPGSGLTEDRLLALAAAAERPSEHPLARAVLRAARERALPLSPATAFTATPGIGVRATVAGRTVTVTSPAGTPAAPAETRAGAAGEADAGTKAPAGADADINAAAEAHADADARTDAEATAHTQTDADAVAPAATDAGVKAHAAAAELERSGHTAVVVALDGIPVGVLGLADRLRPDAAATVAAMRELTGAGPVLLTGDNPRAAGRVAGEVGITDVRAGLLPQHKVAAVRELEASGRPVLMVGDGVNDAPALAAAHTGVAMGRAGSDLALETADAVVVRDELSAVPAVVALSRRARRLVVQNLVLAATFIAALATWDLVATLPLPLGVLGHEGSTVLVGLNGLRLLRESAWRRASAGIGTATPVRGGAGAAVDAVDAGAVR
ncbi:heavy metal translocating P-type ATPase [Streptomyces sp. TLI_171]|uniref:heavy metal translocating P-type ATPase n=1 Tax=Streptomyces sp. TLI_171 TaxID=1938859 RepID=UPI000C19B800|nr:heavy metal translocating P-type ATPase [Streptomyces sp. TLI_171]RKE23101.1 P-type E1-E2 ATPase/heavy metal translocating P-type ATPase [Streptomyces sp. TLI_171]